MTPKPASSSSTKAVISIGDTVVIKFADSAVETYRLEYRPYDMSELSATSPLGEALLGRCAGDKVEYRAPKGRTRLQIMSVR